MIVFKRICPHCRLSFSVPYKDRNRRKYCGHSCAIKANKKAVEAGRTPDVQSEIADEVVHHKNHNPRDNRPENLQVMSREDHSRLHSTGVVRPKPTHCKYGHPFGEGNIIRRSSGRILCLTCVRKYDREWKVKKRQKLKETAQ